MKQKLDALLERDLAKGDYVGANAAVWRKGEPIYRRSIGLADREAGTDMAPGTIFRVYSLTKPVTAVAVMQLVAAGLLHTDTPVGWYMPEYNALRVIDADGGTHPAHETLLVRHLLNMTSGFPYPGDQDRSQRETASFYGDMTASWSTDAPIGTREYCRRMAEIPLRFEPGSHWDYGTSADILGGLIEVVSGMPLDRYLRTHIFDPLGMDDTGFFVPPEKIRRFAASYIPSGGTLVRDDQCYLGLNDQRSQPAFLSGGAGLVSTIEDYGKFAAMLAGGGVYKGTRILSRRAIDAIRTPQVFGEGFSRDQDWDSLHGYAYGSLVRVLTDPAAAGTLATPGEFGWDGMTGCYFCADPSEELAILFWIQRAYAGTSMTAKLMRNIVYGAL